MKGHAVEIAENASGSRIALRTVEVHGDTTVLDGTATLSVIGSTFDENGPDPEENPGLPAVYTYLGQFADHDLTFDPVSQLRERVTQSQLRTLADFRTPRFDLDSLYRRGP